MILSSLPDIQTIFHTIGPSHYFRISYFRRTGKFTTALNTFTLTYALALIFCAGAILSVRAQDTQYVDSLEQALLVLKDTARLEPLRDLYMEFLQIDHLRAKSYLDEYVDISNSRGSKSQKAMGLNILGVYCNVTSNYKEGILYFEQAKALYYELGNMERVSALLNNMSIANRNMGHLKAALQNQMESLKIKDSLGVDEESLAASYWNIGNIQGDIKNYSESNSWYRKAEHIYDNLGLTDDLIDVRQVIAINLRDMDSTEAAKPIFLEALQYYRQKNYYNSIAGMLDILGNLHQSEGNLDSAKMYYLEALKISLDHGEASLPGLLYRRLANVARKQGDYDLALDYAQRALEISRQTGVRKKMITDFLVLSEVKEAKGNLSGALEDYKAYHALNDSVFAEEKILAMNELEIKYQTEKKEQEIQLLNEKAKRNVLMQRSLLGTLIGLVVLLLTLVYGIRQRKRRNAAEKEKLDAEIEFRKRELSAFAMQLAQKNETLKTIQDDLSSVRRTPQEHRELSKIGRKIDQTLSDDANWNQFLQRFEAVHQGYEKKITEAFPDVTPNDLRLMALIKMNLSNKEIANILNLSTEGIKKARYRLRKKLQIETTQSLEDTVIELI